MRKLIYTTIVVIGVSPLFFVGGCAQLQTASNLVTAATKSYDNPVTEQELYQIEASLRIVVEALLTYRRQCIAGNVDVNCRQNIELIQPYTRQVKPLLIELRQFVRNDDKVNGIVVYKRLANIYNQIVSTASARGMNLGV